MYRAMTGWRVGICGWDIGERMFPLNCHHDQNVRSLKRILPLQLQRTSETVQFPVVKGYKIMIPRPGRLQPVQGPGGRGGGGQEEGVERITLSNIY